MRCLPLGLLLLAAAACRGAPPGPGAGPALVRVERSARAMGTTFRVVVYAPDEARGEAGARAALARVDALEALLTDWDPASPTRRLGETVGAAQEVPPDLFRVLELSARAVQVSDGAFDPTVGPLTRCWRRALRQGEAPDPAELEHARAAVGWRHVALDPERSTVTLAVPGMALDFGGIAKGYALDRALATLAELGLERALVDGGGDLALGAPPPGEPGWKVAVEPFGDAGARCELFLSHCAVATSGELYQSAVIDGARYTHLIDPRTGSALSGGLAATVVGPDAALTDALASALCVLGEAGLARVRQLDGFRAWVHGREDPPAPRTGVPPLRSGRYDERPGRTPMTQPTRRDLLTAAGTVAVGAGLAPSAAARPRLSFPNSAKLRVGLVGCGGRGTGAAANALRADPNVELVAMGDTFADMLEQSLAALLESEDIAPRVAVAEDMRFTGFDAFEHVIASCDVVLLATPPHFRPQHLAAAVAAGKHVFCEKPVAVDPPGVRSVLATARAARDKRLSLVSGLCYRYHFAKRETLRRLHEGAIGEIVALQTTYNTGGLWHRGRGADWSDMEWQVRNWLYFTWLSGDHVVEQHIHSLDKLAWAMGDRPPLQVTASGGRQVRTGAEYGNVYDHFNSVFEWPGGVKGFSSCRQWNGAAGDVSDHVFGTRGTAHLQTHQIEAGPWSWRWRSDAPDDMYQNEHDALFASIRAGEPLNDGQFMSHSTLMAIMARMSAYTGRVVTWEEALGSDLDLSPAAYEWGALATPPVAHPG